jgi:nitrogen fixation protein FixH
MSLLAARSPRSSIIPWLFVAGFAIVIAVNGVMIWLALSSFSGLYSDHARDRGLHYNQVVAEQQQRDALGWTVRIDWQAGNHRLQIALSDAAGKPLSDATVSVELIRPAERRAPLGVVVTNLGDGRYGGTVELPARGNWDADIVVEARGKEYAVTKRLFLQ